ncbi:response regulator [Haloplanus sp. GCM10025708]|uniref:response regulator n=1 Tax=Haloferacaceae TaxID=1644056 RepID=UPI00360DE391
MHESERTSVLVVDDDPDVVRTYQRYLEAEYDVAVAFDGEEALDVLESTDADVAFLDRATPDRSGEALLGRIGERGHDCRVAMVTAVDPDFDVLEAGFDDYVTKPASRADLRSTVERLVALDEYARNVRQYHSLVSKRAALGPEETDAESERSDRFSELDARIEREREFGVEPDRLLEDAAFVTAIRAIDDDARSEADG